MKWSSIAKSYIGPTLLLGRIRSVRSLESRSQTFDSVSTGKNHTLILPASLLEKNDEVDKSQQFILYHLGGDCIFIERNKEGYVRRLINEWIDTTSTPKKDEENVNQKRRWVVI